VQRDEDQDDGHQHHRSHEGVAHDIATVKNPSDASPVGQVLHTGRENYVQGRRNNGT
jgi:hypothetical protein